jgi:L-lactate dehydrogenase (cytochrome)
LSVSVFSLSLIGVGMGWRYANSVGTVLKDEMESVMKLIGIRDLSEVHPGLVNTSDVDHLVPSTDEHPYAKWRPKPPACAKL